MATVALKNSFQTQVAFFFEPAQGELPGGSVGNAADWEAAEALGDAFRLKITEGDPAYILGDAAVPNVDMQPGVFDVGLPHKGLPTADGGAITQRLWSTGDIYADGLQILAGTQTNLGRLLIHALGRGDLGNYTTVGVVTTQTTFTVASAANIQPGYLLAIEAAADPGRFYTVQVLAVSGTDITTDRELPFTITAADRVSGMEMAWPDAEGLTNPLDADYSTLSILYGKATDVWVAGGAHLSLDEITLERGEQPAIGWAVLAAKGYPQGGGGPPDALPDFDEPIEGTDRDVKAVGHDTIVYLQDAGTDTWDCTSVFEASFTPGVPVIAEDGVTECDSNFPGRVSYRTEPAETTLELVVALTDDQQARWTAGTVMKLTYMQVGDIGRSYALHMRKVFLMAPPEAVLEGVNKWRMVFQATGDSNVEDPGVDTGPALAAKFVLGRF